MTIREEFEKRFPVPDELVWDGAQYNMHSVGPSKWWAILDCFNAKWIGFQAGWEAAKQQGEVK